MTELKLLTALKSSSIAFIVLILLACNNDTERTKTVTENTAKDLVPSIACDQSLEELIRRSSLQSPFKKDVKALIEKENGEEITVQLVVAGDRQNENTVGWVVINTGAKTMVDITNDPENPQQLRYKAEDWDRFILCRR